MFRFFIVAILGLAVFAPPASAGNCHQLFRQQQFVHRQHHAVNYGHALNQAVYGHHYVQPQILYLVGQALVQDAHIRKVAADEWERRGGQPATQQTVAVPAASSPAPVPAGDGVALMQTYCAKCHQGGESMVPEKFDLDLGVRLSAYKHYTIMAGRGEKIPDEMAGVMKRLTGEQKGLIMEAMQDMATLPEEIADSTNSGELQ